MEERVAWVVRFLDERQKTEDLARRLSAAETERRMVELAGELARVKDAAQISTLRIAGFSGAISAAIWLVSRFLS